MVLPKALWCRALLPLPPHIVSIEEAAIGVGESTQLPRTPTLMALFNNEASTLASPDAKQILFERQAAV